MHVSLCNYYYYTTHARTRGPLQEGLLQLVPGAALVPRGVPMPMPMPVAMPVAMAPGALAVRGWHDDVDDAGGPMRVSISSKRRHSRLPWCGACLEARLL